MKIPNAENPVIAAEKLRDYALSPSHPVGRFKAAYFKKLGYTDENWEQLEKDLRKLVLSQNAQEIQGFPHGRKFVVTEPLTTPSKKTVKITSVWVILRGEDSPRFVTVYPGGPADEF